MGIGLRLKQLLRDRRLTIKQLAEDTGIPLNTLYSITKRDPKRADQVIINRIADVLEVPPALLLEDRMPVKSKRREWSSDKGSRLYMCIDTDLLRLLELFAKADGLSLEDEVEKLLHDAVENRIGEDADRTGDVTEA